MTKGCRRQIAAASALATTSARSARYWTTSIRISSSFWGDDQYENFREDIVPAFCLLGYDADFELKPWHTNGHGGNGGKPNRWGEPGDWRVDRCTGTARRRNTSPPV